MNAIDYDTLIRSLILVRIGQELGTDSKLARLVHDAIELLAAWQGSFLG